MRNRLIGTLGIALTLGLPAAAGGAPTWLTPSGLSQPGQNAEAVDAAMGAGGGAALAWMRSDGTYVRAQAAVRQPLGSFGSALTLSPEKQDAIFPQVATDGAGDATVVWENATGSPTTAEVATVVAGIPSTPVVISGGSGSVGFPVVAVDERGEAIAAWTSNNGSEQVVEAAFRPAGGSFGKPAAISKTGEPVQFPRVAIDGAGDATVVWFTEKGAVEAAWDAHGTGFASPAVLAVAGQKGEFPQVATDVAGDTVVGWLGSDGKGHTIAQAATRPAGAAGFGAPVVVSAPERNAASIDVAVDGRGDPTAVWSQEAEVQVATGTPAGVFSTPAGIGYPGVFTSIAEDPAGDTLVGYFGPLRDTAVASFRAAGGRFTAPEPVSPPGQKVSPTPVGTELGMNVAVDAQGDGLLGYRSESGGVYLAGESLLDAAGPQLTGLSVPASATAGTPATFAAGPIDQLSGVSSTTWSFGDGASASGPAVTHTFANPGTYTVSVTAADGVGNSTTKTATIAVVAPPTPSPAPPLKAASLGSSTVSADSHGHVALKVRCPVGGATCTGTVALTLPAVASGLAVAARAHGVPVTVAAGRVAFTVAAGQTRTVRIALPAVVTKLLAKRHSLKLTAIVQTSGAPGQSATRTSTLTVRAPKKRRQHKGKRH